MLMLQRQIRRKTDKATLVDMYNMLSSYDTHLHRYAHCKYYTFYSLITRHQHAPTE